MLSVTITEAIHCSRTDSIMSWFLLHCFRTFHWPLSSTSHFYTKSHKTSSSLTQLSTTLAITTRGLQCTWTRANYTQIKESCTNPCNFIRVPPSLEGPLRTLRSVASLATEQDLSLFLLSRNKLANNFFPEPQSVLLGRSSAVTESNTGCKIFLRFVPEA